MKIIRQIPIEFESDGCTEEELKTAAEYKLRDIRDSIGLSGIFPVGNVKKIVFWHVQQGSNKQGR